jgi:predicted dinucleotide-binding enzyme
VVISASKPESARTSAEATGATAAASNLDAVRGADVVVLAVPHGAVEGIVAELGDALNGVVVVDATNPLNDTFTDLVTVGTSAAEQLQARVPGAAVVKAFNTLFASRHAAPTEDGTPLDAFIAGDDSAAKNTVAELATSLGYRPVDAGGMRMARSLEELAFLNITLNATNGWAWQSAWKLVGPTGSAS